jgi:hypothetical protein
MLEGVREDVRKNAQGIKSGIVLMAVGGLGLATGTMAEREYPGLDLSLILWVSMFIIWGSWVMVAVLTPPKKMTAKEDDEAK